MNPNQAQYLANRPMPKNIAPPNPANWQVVEEKKPAPVVRAPIPPHLLRAGGRRAPASPSRDLAIAEYKPRKPKVKPTRKKGWRDVTAGQALDYGRQAWSLAKYLATLVNVEDKKWDIDGTAGVAISTTPTVINLTNIPEGSEWYERSGNSVLGQHIEFRARIRADAATVGSTVRILLVCDKHQIGTDPVLGDVLNAGTSPLIQPLNYAAQDRFTILYDELVTLVPTAYNSGTSSYVPCRLILPSLIRKWNQHVLYGASATADSSNRKNALYLMAVSDETTNTPTLFYTWRFHFTDN